MAAFYWCKPNFEISVSNLLDLWPPDPLWARKVKFEKLYFQWICSIDFDDGQQIIQSISITLRYDGQFQFNKTILSMIYNKNAYHRHSPTNKTFLRNASSNWLKVDWSYRKYSVLTSCLPGRFNQLALVLLP